MKKLLWILPIIVVITAMFLMFGAKKQKDVNDVRPVVKIGVLLPLTGDNSTGGQIAQHALKMSLNAVEDKNTKYKYDLIVENADPFDAKATRLGGQKLINVDKVDFIISYWNNQGIAISAMLQESDIPHINFGNDKTALENKNTVLVYSYLDQQTDLLVDFLEQQKYKSAAILYTNNHWGVEANEKTTDAAEDVGIKITNSVKINFGEKNPEMILSNIQKNNPDIYILLLESPELEIVKRRMDNLGIDKPVTAIESISYSEQKELFENEYFVDLVPGSEDFSKKFEDYSGIKNNHYGAVYMYDIIQMIVNSFENSAEKSGALTELIETSRYNGQTGIIEQTTNRFFTLPSVLKKIENGNPVVVK